jgi:hypothetical protein
MGTRNEANIKYAVDPVSIKKTAIIIGQKKKCVFKIHNGKKKEHDFLLNSY